MSAFDILVVVILAVGLIRGYKRGFLSQLAGLVGLVAGLLIARALYISAGEYLAVKVGTSVMLGQVLAFFLIWIAVPMILSLIANLLTKALQVVCLDFINRLLGAVLGGMKYLLLLSLLLQLVAFVDPEGEVVSRETMENSELYDMVESFSGIFIPVIDSAGEQLKTIDV